METNHATTASLPPVLTTAQAVRRGLYRLTSPYQRHEQWMMLRVLADLTQSGIAVALVSEDGGLAIYRGRRTPSPP